MLQSFFFLLLTMKTNDLTRVMCYVDVQVGFSDCMYIAGIR